MSDAKLAKVALQDWLDKLMPGDMVGVYDYGGAIFRHEREVVRRTPTKRIVLQGGATFQKDGRIFGRGVSGDRCLRPAPKATSCRHRKEP